MTKVEKEVEKEVKPLSPEENVAIKYHTIYEDKELQTELFEVKKQEPVENFMAFTPEELKHTIKIAQEALDKFHVSDA